MLTQNKRLFKWLSLSILGPLSFPLICHTLWTRGAGRGWFVQSRKLLKRYDGFKRQLHSQLHRESQPSSRTTRFSGRGSCYFSDLLWKTQKSYPTRSVLALLQASFDGDCSAQRFWFWPEQLVERSRTQQTKKHKKSCSPCKKFLHLSKGEFIWFQSITVNFQS